MYKRDELLQLHINKFSNKPRYLQELIHQPFNLATDFPIRVHLLQLAEQEYILAISLHHIASDGWSVNILLKELSEYYRATIEQRKDRLASLTFQYANYASWQRKQLSGVECFGHDFDISLWWRAKQGIVEVKQSPVVTDFRDALMVDRSVITELNGKILSNGAKYIKRLRELKDFRRDLDLS